jgi:succinate dehydrogenase/fumarate reductase cytochrome b subunit
MRFLLSLLCLLSVIPSPAWADDDGGIQTFIKGIVNFLNDVVIYFLLAIGFLFFVYNAIRYFVFEGSNEDGQKKAKNLAVYSVMAFVLIIILWAIVNMLAETTGLQGEDALENDYIQLQNKDD